MAENSSHKRQSLQDLLPWSAIVMLLAVPIVCVATRVAPQWRAVKAIRAAGGVVQYTEMAQVPNWLRRMLGPDFFEEVVIVELPPREATDSDLEWLKGVIALKTLILARTKITDAGLQHLTALTQLRDLDLADTNITDTGLEHLEGLTQLRSLRLNDTKISDTGLEHLKPLKRLEYLALEGTEITDAGLKYLEILTELKTLDLRSAHKSKATDAGIESLKKALPELKIR